MPTEKTEGTELSVAFGLMQLDPSDHLNEKQVARHFEGTLPYAKYADYFDKFARAEKYYRRFYAIGLNLARRYPQFATSEIRSLRWEGPKRQTTSVSLSVDLVVQNTRVSVKADSDIVYNRSAFTLFEQMPRGLPEIKRSPNWYLLTAPDEYQTWYAYAKDCWGAGLPVSVEAFHSRGIRKKRRIEFPRTIKSSEKTPEFGDFQRLYVQFCDVVAERTSARFNNSYSTLRSQPYFESANTAFVRTLFRIGEANYVHCGLEGSSSFAVEIPDLSTWARAWRMRQVVASPDTRIRREQPVVVLKATLENRAAHRQDEFEFEVQVRWSHGRFCGNPEAKIYKLFAWRDVPGVATLFGDDRYEKVRRITTGGFGTVYEAIDRKSGRRLALKELCVSEESAHETARFVREARLMSALNHPNIIQIVDYDIDCDPPWFTMPLADCSLIDMVDCPGGMEDGDLLQDLFDKS